MQGFIYYIPPRKRGRGNYFDVINIPLEKYYRYKKNFKDV